ncbi:hypothetical protein M2273_002686 [Mucilaginibacter lappiensis]|jgi:hypothetical protein
MLFNDLCMEGRDSLQQPCNSAIWGLGACKSEII